MKRALAALVVVAACKHAPAPATSREWIEKSNQNSQILLDVTARFSPEQAARLGIAGLDDRIPDFTPGHRERLRQAVGEAVARLEEKKEENPLVEEDLEILVRAAKRQIRGSELSERLEVPYTNLPRLVFGSVRN